VAYWIFEAREVVVEMLRFAKLPFVMVTVEGVETWSGENGGGDEAYVRLRVLDAENVVRVRLPRAFAELAQSPDNTADRHLLSGILEGLARLTGYPDLESIGRALDDVAPPGPKKMLMLLDVGTNPDIGPNDVPAWRRVQNAPVSDVLDELGLALQRRGWRPPAGDVASDPTRILNDAVAVLLEMLEREVQAFEPSLLDVLILRNDAILRERAEAGYHLIPRLACFPGELTDAQKRIDGLDAASVAGRFLIEFVAAQPPRGQRTPSLGAVDRLLAIADVLIVRGHASDIEHLGLARTNARMLVSGRLGIDDRALSAAWHAFSPSVQLTRAEQAHQSFMSRWHQEPPSDRRDLETLDRACLAEWRFSFTDLGRLIGAAISLSVAAAAPVFSLPAASAAETLAAEAEIAGDAASAILDQLTLAPRESYIAPPLGFNPIDLFPWRYNRALSFLRRPLVMRSREEGDELVFGRRALLESLHYLLELIETSRLRPTSRAMAEYVGRRSVQRGAEFNDRVAKELSEVLGSSVRRRVSKLGRMRIANERGPLGDVDVLGVDHARRILWAIECKALAPSRTPSEVSNELRDLLGVADRLGHVGKHVRLVEWLRGHRAELMAELGVEGDDWQVEGLFVVDEDLYGPYFRETPIPVVPFRRVRETVLAARDR